MAPSPGLLSTVLDEFSPGTVRFYYEDADPARRDQLARAASGLVLGVTTAAALVSGSPVSMARRALPMWVLSAERTGLLRMRLRSATRIRLMADLMLANVLLPPATGAGAGG